VSNPEPARASTATLPDVDPDTRDALVIGGGPAGAAAGAQLARLGRRVLVFDRITHPRFHIGESLLPFTMHALGRIGFAPTLEAAGFTPKQGATFVLADGRREHTFFFGDGMVPVPGTFQVLRSRFDHLLLEHAEQSGAEIRQGHHVVDVETSAREPIASVRPTDGPPYRVRGRFVVDATGRDALLAHRQSLVRPDPALRKVALFAHYTGATRDAGRASGNTVSVVIRDGWIWFIPMANDVASIGVVVDGTAFKAAGLSGDAYFEHVLRRVPAIATRLSSATRVSPVRATSDFSYTTSAMTGPNWLLAGDAGFFLDPIFSSGVHLAITSGIAAAEAIDECLAGRRAAAALARYERKIKRAQKLYRAFIAGWYRPGFQELLLAPSTRIGLVQAVTSALAGAPTTWPLAWRLRVFMLLARINGIVPLVPRLDRSQLPP
jgi:flavin-dependent dehydrogenase